MVDVANLREYFELAPISPIQESQYSIKKPLKMCGGAAAGLSLGFLFPSTGTETIIHEYGHVAALHLTREIPRGKEPVVQVNGLDHFEAMKNSTSPGEGIQNFFHWLLNGAGGSTSYSGNLKLTPFGKVLGEDGSRALVAIAGSLPSLMINSASVAAGAGIVDEHPVAGSALLAFGTMNHALTSIYPWSAVAMSEKELAWNNANTGHDFARFAVKISDITGIPSTSVALSTALIWTGVVPAIGIGVYFYQKHQQYKMVPDVIAVKNHILHASKETLEKYLNQYPRKDLLLQAKSPEEAIRFIEFLADNLPKKVLKASKREVLRNWKKQEKSTTFEKALGVASVIGVTTAVASRLFEVLSLSVAPVLAPIAAGLNYACPIFMGISLISSGYETYKDLKCDKKVMPKLAKVLSVAKLVTSVVGSIALVVAVFIPGLNVVAMSLVVLGCVGSIILGVVKSTVIKKRYQLHLAIDPNLWALNLSRLKQGSKMADIKKWVVQVRKADQLGLLSLSQRNDLSAHPLILSSN